MDSKKQCEEPSDAELMHSFVTGNAAAMNRLMLRYKQALFAWLLGMTGNRADAEDLFQDCWLRVIRAADRFSDVSFKAWLWRIARNLLIDFRRKRKPDCSLDESFGGEDGEEIPLGDKIASKESTPAQRIELSDMHRRAMHVVAGLPEIQREVFLLRVEGNFSFKEIAAHLGVPLNTALGRMHDAMEKIKRELAAEAVQTTKEEVR